MATYDDILDGTSYAPRGVDSRHTEPPRRGPVEIPADSKPTEVPSAPIAVEKPEPQEKPKLSYLQLFEALSPDKPETPAERAAREKKEKREVVFSAIGDGISALSNLFFTTQYAPNSYDPSRSMSARTRERLDRLKAEREANLRAYREGYIRAASMDDANNRDNRNWRHQLEREAIADKRAETRDKRDSELEAINLSYYQARAEKEKGDAARAKVAAEMEAERITSIINRNNKSGALRGSRSGAKYKLHAPDGDHYYNTAAEYNAAVYGYAQLYPEHVGTLYETVKDGKSYDTPFKTAEVAAQVENIPKGATPKQTDSWRRRKRTPAKDKSTSSGSNKPPLN